MRHIITLSVAALSLVATLAHADQGAPPPRQQPYVNVPDDQQDDGNYQYPPPDDNQRGVVINNNNYQFNGNGEYLAPGYGIPQQFNCNTCAVNYSYSWAEVIAYGNGGAYRIWAGPPGPNNAILITAVNSIKNQTGMCPNLPYLQPVPVYNNGPAILPFPGPGPVWGPRPGWGPRPVPVIPGPRPGWGRRWR